MDNNKRPTQCDRLLDYMKRHPKGVTQLEALSELGILRLASRISELKRDGEVISKRMVDVTNKYGEVCRVAQYRLVV